MNVGTIIFIFILSIVALRSLKLKKQSTYTNSVSCFIDKLIIPFSSIYTLWNPNNILIVDYIKKDSISINTKQKHLYALEVNEQNNISEEIIHELYKSFSSDKNGFFFQAILKNGKNQKQYIFSYSKELIQLISNRINTSPLAGEEILKILKKIVFVDSTKEKLNMNSAIKRFRKDLTNNIEVYQGYKAKEGHIDDIYQKLKETDIEAVIWGYYDFYQGRINGYIKSKLTDYELFIGPKQLAIVNFILISKNLTKENLNKISNIYNISLVKKSINSSEIISKTPLKHRDVEWDLLVNLDYLSSQFIIKG